MNFIAKMTPKARTAGATEKIIWRFSIIVFLHTFSERGQA